VTVTIYVLGRVVRNLHSRKLVQDEVRLRASVTSHTSGGGAPCDAFLLDAVRSPRSRRRDVTLDDRTVDGADHHGLGTRHRTAESQLEELKRDGHRGGRC